jgi:hypothetical protein
LGESLLFVVVAALQDELLYLLVLNFLRNNNSFPAYPSDELFL